MAFLLDTNIAIRLRDGDPETLTNAAALDPPVCLSIVSRVELEGGVYRDRAFSGARRARLDAILRSLPTLPFEEADADAYRLIVEAAGYSRRKLLDRMIAAQALVRRATLVTANGADFADIPALSMLKW